MSLIPFKTSVFQGNPANFPETFELFTQPCNAKRIISKALRFQGNGPLNNLIARKRKLCNDLIIFDGTLFY